MRYIPLMLHTHQTYIAGILVCLSIIINQTLFSADNNQIINNDNSAISYNDKYIITHAITPGNLVILDAKNRRQLNIIPVIDKTGKSSRIAAMHDARSRKSFIIALKDSPELWEINYQNPPPAGFGTWVHDYRKDSGEAVVKLFSIRRLTLNTALDNFFFDENYVYVISVSCKGSVQLIDLDLGRKVAKFNLSKPDTDIKWITDNDRKQSSLHLEKYLIRLINLKAPLLIRNNCQSSL